MLTVQDGSGVSANSAVIAENRMSIRWWLHEPLRLTIVAKSPPRTRPSCPRWHVSHD